MALRQQISDEEMLRETAAGMKGNHRIGISVVPEGAKFVVVHPDDAEPDWLKELPTERTMSEKYSDTQSKKYRPLLKVEPEDKFFFWDPDNETFMLGGRTLLITMHGTYGPEEVEIDED